MATGSQAPRRGEVWLLDFDPTKGHEQAGKRPALVLSVDLFNSGPAGLVIVCPITSRNRHIRSHVEIAPPEGGLHVTSYVMAEHIRSVSSERLVHRLGVVGATLVEAVEDRIRILLSL
jgi:mRNA interferase MazF